MAYAPQGVHKKECILHRCTTLVQCYTLSREWFVAVFIKMLFLFYIQNLTEFSKFLRAILYKVKKINKNKYAELNVCTQTNNHVVKCLDSF